MTALFCKMVMACVVCGSTGHHAMYNEGAFRVLAKRAGVPESERGYAWRIALGESRARGGVDPQAQNPRSSAAGLFGKMQSVHGRVSPCPIEQVQWADRYARRRYGSWKDAWAFKRRRGWW